MYLILLIICYFYLLHLHPSKAGSSLNVFPSILWASPVYFDQPNAYRLLILLEVCHLTVEIAKRISDSLYQYFCLLTHFFRILYSFLLQVGTIMACSLEVKKIPTRFSSKDIANIYHCCHNLLSLARKLHRRLFHSHCE